MRQQNRSPGDDIINASVLHHDHTRRRKKEKLSPVQRVNQASSTGCDTQPPTAGMTIG
jgi:hypothetical protein